MSLPPLRLNHTMIRVADLEKSLAFYEGFLGLSVVRRVDLGGEATLVFLSDAQGRYFLELTWNQDGRSYELGNQFGHLAFLTDDLGAVLAEVQARGLWFRRSKPGSRSTYLFIRDPDGYEIEILQSG